MSAVRERTRLRARFYNNTRVVFGSRFFEAFVALGIREGIRFVHSPGCLRWYLVSFSDNVTLGRVSLDDDVVIAIRRWIFFFFVFSKFVSDRNLSREFWDRD